MKQQIAADAALRKEINFAVQNKNAIQPCIFPAEIVTEKELIIWIRVDRYIVASEVNWTVLHVHKANASTCSSGRWLPGELIKSCRLPR